jgi:hypothetical protein
MRNVFDNILKIIYLCVIVLYLPVFAESQESASLIEVNSSVDTSVITIGDRITYTVEIDYVSDMRVEKPGAGVNLGMFEIKDYQVYPPAERDGRTYLKYEYVISVFDTGKFTIPPFPVAYFPEDSTGPYKIIEASAIDIYVESLLIGESQELRDIKPVIDIPPDYMFWISLLIIVVLCGIIFYLGYRFYKKRKEKGYLIKPAEPPRPAHEIALEFLEELLKKDLLGQGYIKDFYIEISQIVRKYIEGRYFVPALEETTFEIIQELKQQDIDENNLNILNSFLHISDFVKFAKYIPEEKENKDVIKWAFEFIENTKLIYKTTPDLTEDQAA